MAKNVFNGNESAKGKGFDTNPQNINSTGLNRKSFASINKELEGKGVTKLTKKDLISAYELIFNSTESELKDIAKDPNTPYALKIIILELNDKKTRSRALADYREYAFGKAQESKDITTNGKDMNTTITFVGLDDED